VAEGLEVVRRRVSVTRFGKNGERGTPERRVHYFQPFGHRTRLVFKWMAIVGWSREAVTTSG